MHKRWKQDLCHYFHKSDNLQYITLVCCFAGTNESSSKRLMFQVLFIFFIISCKIRCKNGFNLFFYEFTKIKIKSFECPKSRRNYNENNAWNIRHLVKEMIIPYTHRHIVSYWRLRDLYDLIKLIRFLIWKEKIKIDSLCPQTRTRRSRVLVAAHHVAFAKQGLV